MLVAFSFFLLARARVLREAGFEAIADFLLTLRLAAEANGSSYLGRSASLALALRAIKRKSLN